MMLGLGNKWITLVFVLILIVDKQSHAERWDFEGDHHEDWVDPTDMLRYDSITKQMKPMETFEIVEDKCTSNAERLGSVDCHHEKTRVDPKNLMISKSTKHMKLLEVVEDKSGITAESRKFNELSINDYPVGNRCTASGEDFVNEAPFMKRFVSYLLKSFNINTDDMKEEQLSFDVTMKVTKVQIELLQKFISSKSKMNIHDIDGILTRLIEEVRIKDYNIYGGVTLLDWGTWMLEKLSYFATSPLLMTLFSCPLLAFLLWRLTPMKILILGLMAVVIVSVVCEYVHQYQKLETQKYVERIKIKEMPPECNPSTASQIQQIYWSLKNILGFEDPCKKYYEAIMIDSRFEINPLTAVSHTMGRVITLFSSVFGNSVGLFWSNAISHFSFFEKIIFVVVSSIIIIAFLYFFVTAYIQAWMRPSRTIRTRPMVEDITSDHQQRTVISLPSQSNFQITLSQLSTAEVCSSCQPAACSLPQPTREVCTEHRSTKIVQTQCLHTDAHRSAVLDRVVYSSDSATQTESIKPESDEENYVNKKAILKKLKRVNRSRRGYYCVTLTYTMYCTPCTFLSPLSSYGWIGVPEDEEYQLMDPVLHPEYDTNM